MRPETARDGRRGPSARRLGLALARLLMAPLVALALTARHTGRGLATTKPSAASAPTVGPHTVAPSFRHPPKRSPLARLQQGPLGVVGAVARPLHTARASLPAVALLVTPAPLVVQIELALGMAPIKRPLPRPATVAVAMQVRVRATKLVGEATPDPSKTQVALGRPRPTRHGAEAPTNLAARLALPGPAWQAAAVAAVVARAVVDPAVLLGPPLEGAVQDRKRVAAAAVAAAPRVGVLLRVTQTTTHAPKPALAVNVVLVTRPCHGRSEMVAVTLPFLCSATHVA